MEISLIILTYNSSKFIEDLLESLIKKYKEKITSKKIEIIVVDNLSSDDTVKKIQRFEGFIKILQNDDNYGFSRGNNLAAKKAEGKFLIFMNPDSQIIKGDLFDLLEDFNDENIGIVGGEILNFSGEKEVSAGKTYSAVNVFLFSLGLEEKAGVRFSPKGKSDVDFVSGALLAIKRNIFEKLGGFDEHYFMYVEDVDLCFRVKKLGLRVLFSPQVTIKHMGQASSNRMFAVLNIYKGLLYFHKKNMGNLSYNTVRSLLKIKAFLLVLIGKLRNNDYLVDTYSEALKLK